MVHHGHDMMLLALTLAEEEDTLMRRRRPFILVKPWIQRIETLMHGLVRKARCDFKRFLSMSPDMFVEVLQTTRPRITKEGHRQQL